MGGAGLHVGELVVDRDDVVQEYLLCDFDPRLSLLIPFILSRDHMISKSAGVFKRRYPVYP